MTNPEIIARADERLDTLVNLDLGGRGVEALYAMAREKTGRPLVGAAADALLSVKQGETVIATTGSVSRAWLSTSVGENDGPSGLAAVVRSLVLARRVRCVLMAEETLLPILGKVMEAAGLSILTMEAAQFAADEGSLAAVTLMPYPVTDEEGIAAATGILDTLKPALLFSTERVGRNRNGIYYSMGGRDYGMGRARIDRFFDLALERKIPVVAIGDGGNEIGMSVVAQAVEAAVKHGAIGDCPCGGGIGAVTGADILLTAAVSNWGCTALCAAMAAREGNPKLLHTPEREAILLDRMVELGLINSAHGIIDANVDGVARDTHIAVAELCRTIVGPALSS
jgi:hypothetical protein